MGTNDVREWTRRLAGYYADILRSSSEGGSRHLYDLRRTIRYGLLADLGTLGVSIERLLEAQPVRISLATVERSGEADGLGRLFEDEPVEAEEEEESVQTEPGGLGANVAVAETALELASLRRIHRTQRGDPFNRETVVGYPVLAARLGSRRYIGPLLTWTVDLYYDAGRQTLEVRRRSDNPALNTLLLSKFTGGDDGNAEVELLRSQLLPLIVSPDFGVPTIEEVVKRLKGILEPLRTLEDAPLEVGGFRHLARGVEKLGAGDRPLLGRWPVLVNGPRSFAFLLDDLEEIARGAGDAAGVVERLVGDLPQEGVGDTAPSLPFHETSDGSDPLWFPLKSNQAQRRTAIKARRARVMVVQGPPGTGKSQTIANLVCDLVTRGKTVLVTSHQAKALEVLVKKLPAIEYLAMAVLRGDRESLRRLKVRLERIQELSDEDVEELRKSVARAEQHLRDLDRDLRALDRRYSELKQLEHERYSECHRYHELRQWARISPEDSPSYDRVQEMTTALKEWAESVVALAPALEDFEKLFRPAGEDGTRGRELARVQYIREVVELVRSVDPEPPDEVIPWTARVVESGIDLARAERGAAALAEWLRSSAPRLFMAVSALGVPEDLDAWVAAARVRGADQIRSELEELEQLAAALGSLPVTERVLTHAEALDALSARERLAIEDSLAVLRRTRFGLLSWHLSPSVRRARAALERHGISLLRATAGQRVQELEAALRWHELRDRCSRFAASFDQGLPQLDLPQVIGSSWGPDLARAIRVRQRVGEALGIAASCPQDVTGDVELDREIYDRLGRVREKDQATCEAEWFEHVARRLRQVRGAQTLARSSPLEGSWRGTVERILRALADEPPRLRRGRLAHAIDELEALVAAYPRFRRLVDLETVELREIPATIRQLRKHICATGAVPDWVHRADLALEAHRLHRLVLGSLTVDPDDLTDVARRLAEGQERRRQLIGALVDRKRRLAVTEAANNPQLWTELLRLGRLLGRMQNTPSLQQLRQSIEYRAVLRVLPCWVCSIDDVARLFPLQAQLFDVLIVDEASQCSQATALPLAFRANQLIVVGDRKQLRPAMARFLAEDLVTLLRERHGLSEHPRATFFNGRESLIELAESCADAREFLNEHFRCDPDIIRWSNGHFYDNRLRIMTRRDPSAQEPPLEVRRLTDADDDPERKVNEKEAEAIVNHLAQFLGSGKARGLTVGVISPYREQARFIDELLERAFSSEPEVFEEYELIASTADGFQGDERDVIYYSFRYGPRTPPGVVRAIQLEEERLNVAFTRARKRAVCFISQGLERFPHGVVRSFLEHAQSVQNEWRASGGHPGDGDGRNDRFDSEFERYVCQMLRERGYRVRTQEPCAGFFIDLVVQDREGRELAVECDGEWKLDPAGFLRPEDYQRQDILERAGWVIHRVSGRRFFLNPEREIERIEQRLREQPTSRERLIAAGPLAVLESGVLAERRVAEPALVEAVVSAESADLKWLGTGPSEWAKNLRKLLRWGLEHIERAAEDFLYDVLEVVQDGGFPSGGQIEYLRELWDSARRRGFDPSREELPE